MRTILVPIDFSKSAKHAAKYAAMVAKQLNANITFLHIYAIPIVSEYNLPPGVEQYIHQNQLDAEVQLQQFVNEFVGYSKIPADRISQRIDYGFIAEKVVDISKKEKASLIIMGTKGISDAFDRWIGTIAQKVMNISDCPVWIIPEEAPIKFPQQFVYAADFKADELNTQHKIWNLIQLFDAKCNVLHINKNHETHDDAGLEMEVEPLKIGAGDKFLSIRNIKGKSIIEGLETFIKSSKPDVLILAHYDKPFLTKIFEPSVSKHFVQEAKLPILIISKNKNLFFD
ncbi:MAG: universal stress protein [Bacteroidota bacterium]